MMLAGKERVNVSRPKGRETFAPHVEFMGRSVRILKTHSRGKEGWKVRERMLI